jgi:hypothetical protein
MMTSPFGRNSAEQFDDLLEGRIDDAPEDLTQLLEFAERVWAVPAPEPRAEFTASLRERLMAEAPEAMADGATDRRLTIAPVLPAGAAKRRRRLAAVVAVVSIGAAATGTAFAAEDSLPGETLYPIKRLVESAQTTVALGDGSKGKAELSQATTRLHEAVSLAKAGQTKRATQTLEDFVSQATKGADLLTSAGKGESIHDFTTTSVTDLDLLSTLLPSTVIAPVVQAIVSIDNAVKQSLPGSGEGITSLPNTLVQMLASVVNPAAAGHASTLTPTPKATAGHGTKGPQASTSPGAGSGAGTGKPKSSTTPKTSPSTLGEVVGGVGDAVGNGVVGGLGDALGSAGASVGGPVGGLVSGVGGAVSGVGGAVSGLLNGVGSLLTPSSSAPAK